MKVRYKNYVGELVGMNASEIQTLFDFVIQLGANEYLHLYNKKKSEVEFVEESH